MMITDLLRELFVDILLFSYLFLKLKFGATYKNFTSLTATFFRNSTLEDSL